MRAKIFLLVGYTALTTATLKAQSLEASSLRGITGVGVAIEKLNEKNPPGLSIDQLASDVELRLRRNGIRVVSMSDSTKLPGAPFLILRVSTFIAHDQSIVPFALGLELIQVVSLDRNSSIRVPATTWSKTAIGQVGADQLRDIREFVLDLVDIFSNQFLSANPPKAVNP